MTLLEFVTQLINPNSTTALPWSLHLFRPELAICVTIVLLLLTRIFLKPNKVDSFLITSAGCVLAIMYSLPWKFNEITAGLSGSRHEIFAGLLVIDQFTMYFRALLIGCTLLIVILSKLSGIPDHEDAPDFYTMLLGATLGMCLMSSANHLLMVFMAVEMASVPSYALAGLLKGRRQSSEAALKYAVYGAGAAGVMLYGISLIAGVTGSCHLPTVASQLASMIQAGQLQDSVMVLVLGGLMLMVGLAFKLSAVPFHFWAPDVYTGASAEVNAFLSVASKAAAFALLIRVVVGLGYGADAIAPNKTEQVPVSINAVAQDPGQFNVADKPAPTMQAAPAPNQPISNAGRVGQLTNVRTFIVWVLGVLSIVTCTFGNLAAYSQTNIKRMLAYSSIAHAGYMLMAVTAGVALTGTDNVAAEKAFAAVPFYLATYLFTNLTAFAIVAFLRNTLHSEQYASYAGLIRTSPGATVCMTIALVSLIGLPPFAGFAGKLQIFAGAANAIQTAPVGFKSLLITMLVAGGLNTAISLYYYLRVVKIMTIDPPASDAPTKEFSLLSFPGIYVVAVTVPIVIFGLFFDKLLNLTIRVSSTLLG
jgi:NADH-quinone oxidoreductase subunit N